MDISKRGNSPALSEIEQFLSNPAHSTVTILTTLSQRHPFIYNSDIKCIKNQCHTMPCLQRLFQSVSPWRKRFNPRPVQAGFVVDKVALGQIFLCVLEISHYISLQMSHIHSFIYNHMLYNISPNII
jgi:hypothetical protein